MSLTRREFGQLALAGVPAAGWIVRDTELLARQMTKPVTKWAGVQVGMNVPYNFGTGNNISAEDLLHRLLEVGVGAVELRAQPVEHFLGSPTVVAAAAAAATGGGGRRGGGGGGGGRGAQPPTPEQIAAQRQAADDVRKWRLAAPTSKLRELRRMYENAGVLIDVVKVDGLYALSDDELDYFFQMARDLGARALSAELPNAIAETKRVGQFADKHKIFAAYHGHAQSPLDFEEAFLNARHNAANLDIGHFTATQNRSPLPFLVAHHDRIPHIHVKDRKLGTNGGQNMPFGQGDTPIRDVLHAIRDNKWNIQATIEFEYPVPEGSTRLAELQKTLAYCREVLSS